MRIVCPLYALSGLVSLGYQVAWFRIFVDTFGSTNLTFALVLCNFIGGLGIGALLSRRVADRLASWCRLSDPLRVYGLVETLVALSVLLTVLGGLLPADLGGAFPYRLDGAIYEQSMVFKATTLGGAIVCLLLPCMLMGVTFPLICHAYARDGRFPSMLYAWNTLGACSGVLLCEFVLLPRFGHDRTLLTMMLVNLALGLFFLVRGGAPSSAGRAEPGPEVVPSAPTPSPAAARYATLVLCAIVSGLLAGALEGDAFKRLRFLGCALDVAMSFISFWAILGIFLGSATVRLVPRLSFGWIKVATVGAFVVYWGAWRLALASREQVEGLSFEHGLGGVLALTGAFVLPAFFLLSLLLPWTCNRIQASGRHLGLAYGLNTVAFCVGVVTFTWFAPRVNIFYSLRLFIVFFAVLAGLVVLLRLAGGRASWRAALAAAALAVAAVVTPRTFEPRYFTPYDLAVLHPVTAMRSNATDTTFVVVGPAWKILYFTHHPMSATTSRAQRYMRLMAHVPLLAQPDPRRALLICFGVGNTASAISKHDTIEQIDVVDLNRNVFATAPEFAATNDDVIDDERLTLINDDGRNFLKRTDRRYDLVTSEPPPPRHEGIYRLYSREYYEEVLAHLTPRGMMTQWVPIHVMSPEAVALVIATFIDVFPHAELFTGYGEEYILIGGREPVDYARLERRFDPATRVGADLRRVDVVRPLEIVARVVQGDATLRRTYGHGRVISDQRNDLAHVQLDPERPAVIAYDPAAVLADLDVERLAIGAELRRTVMDLARLKWFVGDFPESALETVTTPGVAGTDVDWTKLADVSRAAGAAYQKGKLEDALLLIRLGLEIAPTSADLVRLRGLVQLKAGSFESAIQTWDEFRRLVPPDPYSEFGTGVALIQIGRPADAIPYLERATRLNPDDVSYHRTLARTLAAQGRHAEAIAAYDRALALTPDDATLQQEREAARNR